MPVKPLTKIARFGSTFELSRFEKPYFAPRYSRVYTRRKKSKSTFKLQANVWRTKRRIRRFVTVLSHNTSAPAFATFTYAAPQHNMQEAIQQWRSFTRRMAKEMPSVAFIRVPERHKSGAVHFHAVLFNLPENLPCHMKKNGNRWIHACPSDHACERRLRSLAKVWGLGFVDLQKVRSVNAIGSYIAKYLTKGEPDWTLFGNHVASCNTVLYQRIQKAKDDGEYWELSSASAPVAVDFAMEDMLNQSTLLASRSFPTRWLGECRFDIFQLVNAP